MIFSKENLNKINCNKQAKVFLVTENRHILIWFHSIGPVIWNQKSCLKIYHPHLTRKSKENGTFEWGKILMLIENQPLEKHVHGTLCSDLRAYNSDKGNQYMSIQFHSVWIITWTVETNIYAMKVIKHFTLIDITAQSKKNETDDSPCYLAFHLPPPPVLAFFLALPLLSSDWRR